MGFTKYKIDVILELVPIIIILGPFLQIINVDRLILMTKILKSTHLINSLSKTFYPPNFEHKVKYLKIVVL